MTTPVLTTAAPVAPAAAGTAVAAPGEPSPGFASALDDALNGSGTAGRQRTGRADDEPSTEDPTPDDAAAQPTSVLVPPGLWALLSAVQPSFAPASAAGAPGLDGGPDVATVAAAPAGSAALLDAVPAALPDAIPAALPTPTAAPAAAPAAPAATPLAVSPTAGTPAAAPPTTTAAPSTAPSTAVPAASVPADPAGDVFSVVLAAAATPSSTPAPVPAVPMPAAPAPTAAAAPMAAAAVPAAPSGPVTAAADAAPTAPAGTDVLLAPTPRDASDTADSTPDGSGNGPGTVSAAAPAPGTDAVFPGTTAAPAPVTGPAPAVDVPGRRPAGDPPVAAQLSRQLAVLTGAPDGSQTMTLVITPDDLGPVSIQATVTDGNLHLTLHGAHEHGRHALSDALPDLRRDLESAGITLTRLEVGADAGGDSSPWARAAQQQLADSSGGQGRPGRPGGQPRNWALTGDHPGEGGPAPASDLSTPRGVDVRV